MAEEQQGAAQNKLGQLYVELGAKGLGNLTKGLNGLSAQFLLTKNAAQQAIKPIVEMSQKSVSQILNYDKLHSIMGIAIKDLQDYKIAAQLIGVSPDLLFSQMKNVQQQILRIRAGFDSNGVQGLALLGIDPRSLNANDPMKVITEIGKKLKTVDESTRAMVLGLLGWNEELAYFFDRVSVAYEEQNSKFIQKLKLNDKELNNLREVQNTWNLLSVTWEQAQLKFISNQGVINKYLQNTIEWLGGEHPILEGIIKRTDEWLNKLSRVLAVINLIKQGYLKDSINQETRNAERNMTPEQRKRYEEVTKKNNAFFEKEKYYYQNKKTFDFVKKNIEKSEKEAFARLENNPQAKVELIKTITGATPLNEQAKAAGLPPLPDVQPSKPMQYLPSNTTKEVQYTVIPDVVVNQYIQGENPQEIAYESGKGFDKAILTSLYNQNLQPN